MLKSANSKHTILVTGATGFTGRYFISLAKSLGFTCVGLTQNTLESGTQDLDQSICCDLTDKNVVDNVIKTVQPHYVVHLAAISFVAHGNTKDIYSANIVGTTNLLDALVTYCPSVKKVLLASSANVYGNAESLPITEAFPISPVNDYSVSKAAMEMAVKLRMPQLPIVVVRPFNYTGVGQAEHFLIPKVVSAFRNGLKTISLGNLDVSRDFSDVRDVVRAYAHLLMSDLSSVSVNICTGESHSLLSIVKTLNKLAGYEIEVEINQAFVRDNEIKNLYGSNELLVNYIGDYQQFNFDETLAWMYRGS